MDAPLLLVNGLILEQVPCVKYLCLLLMTCHGLHTFKLTALRQGNSRLCMIYRQFSEHSSPGTESMIWPHLKHPFHGLRCQPPKRQVLEGIQNKNCDSSYEDLLDAYKLPELSNRRPYLRLSLLSKIVHDHTIFLQLFSYPCSPDCIMLSYTCIASHLHTITPSFTHLCPAL